MQSGHQLQANSVKVVYWPHVRTPWLPNSTLFLTTFFLTFFLTNSQAQGSREVLFATVSLLALVLPNVPRGVLRVKLDASLAVVSGLLSEMKGGESGAGQGIVKASLGCLQTLLQSADHSNWLKLARPFGLLLHHCIDGRPKVRRSVHFIFIICCRA
jgi:hypothetical protein